MSYWSAIRPHRMGRVSAGPSRAKASGSPTAGRYSRTLLIRLILGSRSNPSSRVMPNPISDKAVGVDVVGLHVHGGAVAHGALDHRGDLGRRAVEELGVDGHRFSLDVPVDQHAPAPVPG